jgi:hypothetical protein
MANIEKQKIKLQERIAQLETELRLSLQKKAVGPAISVPKYTANIQELKKQLSNLK